MIDFVISEAASTLEALALIDKTGHGIVFAVDASGKLTGILTDGDIRRALLKGHLLQAPISQIMQRKYTSLPANVPLEVITSTLSNRVVYIPLLDEMGRPVDYASVYRSHRIPVSEPSLNGNELAYVVECIKTNWVSSQGRFVNEFEKSFSDFHSGLPALSVSNGTVALHLALVSLGIGKGDEVIVPDLTFAASINAVLHAGATPVLVDVDPTTWTLNPDHVRRAITKQTRAIMPVHLYGHPCDMSAILSLAKEFNLLIIEDCAEALGAEYQGQRVGTFGDAGCFSFYGNKLITTGEGGMILFKKASFFERAKILRDHGMSPQKRYWHQEIGFNFRLTNLQAAIGLAQMEQVAKFIQKKIDLAMQYKEIFSNIPGILCPQTAPWAKNVYWLYTIRIENEFGTTRDELMRKLLHNGIETRPLFYPLHQMPIYTDYAREGQFAAADLISASGLSLPSAVTLTADEVDRVGHAFSQLVGLKQLLHSSS